MFYEGSEGDTIRLLKQNTVEAVVLLGREKSTDKSILIWIFPDLKNVTLRLHVSWQTESGAGRVH